ncbi:hypothetical protein FLX35_05675 [Cylindrospermopsis raciborskii LB2897]|nr:hypothetical protein [Cylindrospermopsis raciborskii LB2897]
MTISQVTYKCDRPYNFFILLGSRYKQLQHYDNHIRLTTPAVRLESGNCRLQGVGDIDLKFYPIHSDFSNIPSHLGQCFTDNK